MKTNLAKWGNSLAVRLPKDVTERLHLTEGSTLDIEVEAGALTLRPTGPRYKLNDLLHGLSRRAMRSAWSWGPDKGREIVED